MTTPSTTSHVPPTLNLLCCALALAVMAGCDDQTATTAEDAAGSFDVDGSAATPEDGGTRPDASQTLDAGDETDADGGVELQPDADVQEMDASPETDSASEDAGTSLEDSDVEEPEESPGEVGQGEVRSVIVAGGANHQLALSIDDGATWCLSNQDGSMSGHDNPNLLRNITYANGYFVAGSWTQLLRSRNGYDWEDTLQGAGRPAFGQWIAQVDYGNGWWVATGGFGTAMRSKDLVTWENTSGELPGNQASRSLAFGNGVFVTGRDGNSWWQSTDGTGWTQRGGGDARLAFNGSDFVARNFVDCQPGGQTCMKALGGGVSRSTDGGASWTSVANLPQSVERFAFGEAPVEDFQAGADMPAELRTCLGL